MLLLSIVALRVLFGLQPLQARTDHLVPVDSGANFIDHPTKRESYRSAVFRHLSKDGEGDDVLVVILPSFHEEQLLSVGKCESGYRLLLRKPREQIWSSEKPIAQIEVSEKSVPLERVLAERVISVLKMALRNTAPASEEDGVLDGVRYIFFGPNQDGRGAPPMIGQCHSPRADAELGNLVKMVDLLVRYVELPSAFRDLKTTDERKHWLDQVVDGKIVTSWPVVLDENRRPRYDPFLWDPLGALSRAAGRAMKPKQGDSE